ncbi:MAG: V4R domain-containing protein [Candidatus Caldarchaeum sp.]
MASPIDSPRAVLCGDHELFLFNVRLSDVPGALLQVLSVFASYGVNVVSVYTTTTDYSQERQWVEVNVIVDLTGKNVSAEQLAKSLNILTVVKDVSFIGKQLPNMLVDELHFPLKLIGDRAIIFREPTIREMVWGVRRQLGTAGEALLYHIGLNIGKGTWIKFKNVIGQNLHLLPQYMKYWWLLHSSARVLDLSVDLQKKTAVIKLENNYECSVAGNYGKTFSNMVRGMLAGMFSELFGVEKCVENKCIGAGDPYCEFVVGETY